MKCILHIAKAADCDQEFSRSNWSKPNFLSDLVSDVVNLPQKCTP